jgi:hypothetical protein
MSIRNKGSARQLISTNPSFLAFLLIWEDELVGSDEELAAELMVTCEDISQIKDLL